MDKLSMPNGDRRKSAAQAAPWGKQKLTGASHWDKVRTTTSKVRLIKGKFLCFVTGAGNGLGRAIAGMAFQDQGILPSAMSGSRVILVDKDEEALRETSGKKMRQFLKHRKIEVELEVVDLENLDEAKNLIEKVEAKQDKDFEHIIFVNNASSLGDATKTLTDYEDPAEMARYWNINITSRMYMTTQICRVFQHSKRTVVHTVRYEAASPTPYLGPSCMATSAIMSFGRTFAQENPNIRVLQFTAGALDTKRVHRLIENCGNQLLQDELKKFKEENKLTIPLEAAKRMIRFIEGDDFTKGEVLDIHDKDLE